MLYRETLSQKARPGTAMEVAQKVKVLESQHKGPEVDDRGDTDSGKLFCDLHTCCGMHTTYQPPKHRQREKQRQINKHDAQRPDPNSNQKLQQNRNEKTNTKLKLAPPTKRP